MGEGNRIGPRLRGFRRTACGCAFALAAGWSTAAWPEPETPAAAPAADPAVKPPAQPTGPQPEQATPTPAPDTQAGATPAPSKALQLPGGGSIDWGYTSLGVYGPTFTSPDGENKATLGLFLWFDNTVVTNDDLAGALGRKDIQGDSRIGTARMELHGLYTEDFFYYFRVDFQNNGKGDGHSAVEWAAFGIQNLPIVKNLLIGLQQPVYSLDIWANYPRHRLMLEPSLANAFYHGELLGITAFDVNMEGHYSWALGVARDTSDDQAKGMEAVSKGQDGGMIHGRLSWFPRYSDSGRHMLHFGISGAYFKPDKHAITYGIWPEVYTDDVGLYALAVLDKVDRAYLGVLEFRAVEGPYWIQSEYFHNVNERDHAPDLTFSSWYVEGGWFVTGEQTVFSPLALNGQVVPTPQFKPRSQKWGALELQARYSELDLTSKEIQGGGPPFTQGAKVHNYTFGVNWFLNPHFKIGIDYVRSVRDDLDNGVLEAIESRIQFNI